MSVLLITADQRRHRYMASKLAAKVGLRAVVSEVKVAAMPPASTLPPEDEATLARHFAARDAAETRWLGEPGDFPAPDVLRVPNGEVNSAATLEWIRAIDPRVIVLYGTGILKDPLLSTFSDRLVNMHLGLSPYYRGAGTNFWPLVNREPECVGATLHRVVSKVDAGAILAQVRPDPDRADNAHDLGTKTIIAGAAAMADLVEQLLDTDIPGVEQNLAQGRVFRQRDFHAGAVREMERQFATGMMPEYIANLESRQAAFPVVSQMRLAQAEV